MAYQGGLQSCFGQSRFGESGSSSLRAPCACASVSAHGGSIRQLRGHDARTAFHRPADSSSRGTRLRAAASSSGREAPGQHCFHVQLRTRSITPFGLVRFSRRLKSRNAGDLGAWQSDHVGWFAVALATGPRGYHAAGCFVKPEAANRPDCCRIGLCCVSACQARALLARALSRRLRQFATGKTARTLYYGMVLYKKSFWSTGGESCDQQRQPSWCQV